MDHELKSYVEVPGTGVVGDLGARALADGLIADYDGVDDAVVGEVAAGPVPRLDRAGEVSISSGKRG